MNILLVGKRSIQESVGVEKKLNNQIAAFEKLGHTVWYTCAGPDGCFLYGPGGPVRLRDYTRTFPAALAEHTNNARMLLAAAQYSAVTFDLAYIRKPLCDRLHLQALAAFRARGTVVIDEIPTYPYDAELSRQKNLASAVFLALDRHYRKKLSDYLNYIATYSMDGEIFGVPTIVVENAVQVEALPLSLPPKQPQPLSLIAVSSMYFWHGYDRLIAGLGAYRQAGGKRPILLHMVGDGPERAAWQALAQKLGVADEVVFHGTLSGPALDTVFDQSHLAVSSLGWYRKGMGHQPTFEIKTRDYISRGKPLLFACVDPRALAVAPYSLQVPNNDTPVDMEAVLAFWDGIHQDEYTQFLRLYALDNLRWETQMEKVAIAAQALRASRQNQTNGEAKP